MAGKHTSKNPDPYDVGVGKRIKFLRVQAGHTQESVGKALNMTFQQVQKYEKGTNRCAPSRLVVMAKLFKVPVSAFFGEETSGNGRDYAELLGTRNRQLIFERLVNLDSARVEQAMLAMLNRMLA